MVTRAKPHTSRDPPQADEAGHRQDIPPCGHETLSPAQSSIFEHCAPATDDLTTTRAPSFYPRVHHERRTIP